MKKLLFIFLVFATSLNAHALEACGFVSVDVNGCCVSFEVHDNNGWYYEIDTGEGLLTSSDSDDNTFEYCYSNSGDYRLVLTYFKNGTPACGASHNITVTSSAHATIVSQDGCEVVYELTFNCSGEDWTFCPDFPDGQCYTGSPDPSGSIQIAHEYNGDGTYQWWFDQDNNGNSGPVTVEGCCDSNSAFATIVSQDGCEVVYELTFNCSGEDWTFCPNFPDGQCYTGSPDPSGSIQITHEYNGDGTFQWWFDQGNNGNSGSVTVEDCCDSNSAFATVVSIDKCCVVYELNFNCSGEDWTFCPDYPNGQCYSGSAPAGGDSTIITHHYDSNGTYQWWFDQDGNGNSGSVAVEDCECEGPELSCEALIPCEPKPIWITLPNCNITICKGSYTRLRVKPTGNQYTYEWTGILPSSNAPWKTKKVTTSGEYSVTVTDTSTGCSSTITFTVNVIDCSRDETTCKVALSGDVGPVDAVPRLVGETSPVSVNIYPNPANDYVTFEIDALEEANVQITLMTGTGKVIRSYNKALNIGTSHLRMDDLNTLATGIYFYQIQIGDGIKHGKLLIK